MNNQPATQMHFDPNKVYQVPMNEIFADDEFNCRGVIDPMTVIDLANDIRDKEKTRGEGMGLIEPITLQPWSKEPGKKYRIVAGYRRFKAHEINKAEFIRALIREGL